MEIVLSLVLGWIVGKLVLHYDPASRVSLVRFLLWLIPAGGLWLAFLEWARR